MAWDPERYLQFDNLRLRPALDLIARIPAVQPLQVVDLGCGPGNVTMLLKERWPAANVLGIDNSTEMLARAGAEHAGVRWEQADARLWQADSEVDVLFSNAALHWLDDHATLFAHLASQLGMRGILAVQMPANFDAPSHQAIRNLAGSRAWRERLADSRMGAVEGAGFYYSLLGARFHIVDVWETVYWQRLTGDNPILSWLSGTTLVPYFSRLGEDDRRAFSAELGEMLKAAYPMSPDGSVLFPFRRLFMVARNPQR
ncbi:methyltransferase domain-containing protein [Azoarcus indigens]|uniref:Trans-aconitate 2-methyltransferase n=1 Tax=Azoarcus indigens TaxID=29545 RepID=A0A4R6DJY4_9RHOO|nr:methyltransferase domain-containing protein [Azoarcus indigens]NMG66421.1 methyltransferase domain-containing protein [Azoarcus indigens]TDN45047.1 trans-aconitate 2-methyltransferase [Azoarcus indigens]